MLFHWWFFPTFGRFSLGLLLSNFLVNHVFVLVIHFGVSLQCCQEFRVRLSILDYLLGANTMNLVSIRRFPFKIIAVNINFPCICGRLGFWLRGLFSLIGLRLVCRKKGRWVCWWGQS